LRAAALRGINRIRGPPRILIGLRPLSDSHKIQLKIRSRKGRTSPPHRLLLPQSRYLYAAMADPVREWFSGLHQGIRVRLRDDQSGEIVTRECRVGMAQSYSESMG